MTSPPATTSQNTGTSRQNKSTWITVVVIGAVVTLLGHAVFYTYLVETGHTKEAAALLKFLPNVARSVTPAICAGNSWCSMKQKQAPTIPEGGHFFPRGKPKGRFVHESNKKNINGP